MATQSAKSQRLRQRDSFGLASDPAYPATSVLELGLLGLAILIKYTQLTSRFPVLADMRFELIINALLCFLVVVRGKSSKMENPLFGYVAFLYFCLVIQVPLSVNISYSWDIFIDRVVKFSMLAYLIANIVLSPKSLKLLLIFFLLACGKISQEGFVGWLTGGLVWENQGVPRLHGSVPIYGSPNSLSGFAVGLIPFVFYLFEPAKKYERLFLSALAVCCVIMVVFTGSRTGYMGVIAFFIYATLQSKAKVKAFVGLFILAAAVVVFTPPDYKDRFMSSFAGHEKEGGSSRARKQILIDAKDVFFAHPLGVGVSAFPFVRMQMFGRYQDTHNLYMEVLTNLGVQGGIAFLLFIFALFRQLSRIRASVTTQLAACERPPPKRSKEKDQPPPDDPITQHVADLKLIQATISALKGFLIVRLVLGMFGMDLYEIYWWFTLGVTLSCYRICKFSEEKTKAFSDSKKLESNSAMQHN